MRIVREEDDEHASRKASMKGSMSEPMQSEPSRTRCGHSFARTRHTSGTKAYSGFARTEYAKKNSSMTQSRRS